MYGRRLGCAGITTAHYAGISRRGESHPSPENAGTTSTTVDEAGDARERSAAIALAPPSNESSAHSVPDPTEGSSPVRPPANADDGDVDETGAHRAAQDVDPPLDRPLWRPTVYDALPCDSPSRERLPGSPARLTDPGMPSSPRIDSRVSNPYLLTRAALPDAPARPPFLMCDTAAPADGARSDVPFSMPLDPALGPRDPLLPIEGLVRGYRWDRGCSGDPALEGSP